MKRTVTLLEHLDLQERFNRLKEVEADAQITIGALRAALARLQRPLLEGSTVEVLDIARAAGMEWPPLPENDLRAARAVRRVLAAPVADVGKVFEAAYWPRWYTSEAAYIIAYRIASFKGTIQDPRFDPQVGDRITAGEGTPGWAPGTSWCVTERRGDRVLTNRCLDYGRPTDGQSVDEWAQGDPTKWSWTAAKVPSGHS